MNQKRKLKSFVLPTVFTIVVVSLVALTFVLTNQMQTKIPDNLDHVSEVILDEDKPVINETKKMVNPYTDTKVTVGKSYYDYKADSTKQESSITKHDNTYMQNSGVDFILETPFDVVSSLDGTVTNVTNDDLIGNTIEIKHGDDYITMYQSLSEVSVKKGDVVTQGQVIGKSGTNNLDKEMGNHLHFELYKKGQVVDPMLFLDKPITETEE